MGAMRFELRSVGKSYGKQTALHNVSFTVTAGENLAILGSSGSGKSTSLRLLAGLEAPDAGSVYLNESAVSKPGRVVLPPHRRGVSLVFQDLALWPNLSAQDNVLMGLSGLALTRRQARTRSAEALSLCGIEELAHRKPGTLSGGQQQRVALARAVAVRPMFLLLDEPYSGLDLLLKSRLLAEVRTLAVLQEMTVILVTHDPSEAVSLCDCAVVLDQGAVVEAGSFETLLRSPRSDLLRFFRDETRRRQLRPVGPDRHGLETDLPASRESQPGVAYYA